MRETERGRKSTRIHGPTKKSSVTYTPEQREQLQRGLRIMARVIARAHLRKEGSRAEPARPQPPSYDRPTG